MHLRRRQVGVPQVVGALRAENPLIDPMAQGRPPRVVIGPKLGDDEGA